METRSETVYSKHTVEFVAVATEYCRYAENASRIEGKEILVIFQRLLPLLYMKAAALPVTEPVFDDGNEKFVTEFDWHRVDKAFRSRLTSSDDYLRVPDTKKDENEGPVAASISEDLADIYQDIKNFILLYQTGTEEVMNDALWECRMNFEEFWGRKLLYALGAIHAFISSGDELAEPSDEEEGGNGNENAFVSKRQKEFRDKNQNELQ
jgi:hypothetical protein